MSPAWIALGLLVCLVPCVLSDVTPVVTPGITPVVTPGVTPAVAGESDPNALDVPEAGGDQGGTPEQGGADGGDEPQVEPEVVAEEPKWLSCYLCATGDDAGDDEVEVELTPASNASGDGESVDPCAVGDGKGNFSSVPTTNCKDIFQEQYGNKVNISVVAHRCFKSVSSMKDVYSQEEYAVVSRGCAFFNNDEACDSNPTAGGHTSFCHCSADLCNGAAQYTLGGVTVLAFLLAARFTL